MGPSRHGPLALLACLLGACTGHEQPPRSDPSPTPPPPPREPPPVVEPPPATTPSRCFAARSDLALPHWPLNSQFADIDGDQRRDLVVNYSLDARVGVLLADGDGGLRQGAVLTLEHDAVGITLGDFDGDEHLDLAASDYQGQNVRIHRGLGDGTFETKARVTRIGKYVGPGVADDFTADGRTDLVVTLWSSLAFMRGRGDFSFTAPNRMPTGQAPEPPLVADFNNDGLRDIATASNDEHHVALLLGRGDGRFEAARKTRCGAGGHALVADDLDHDGELDLAVANIHSHDVCVLRGDGRGNFAIGPVLPGGQNPHGLAAADVTGDGLLDLVVAAWGTDPKAPPGARIGDGAVIVHAGDGNGGFATRAAVAVGHSPNDVWIDDLDRDGHNDAITLNSNGRSVTILRGAPCPPPA